MIKIYTTAILKCEKCNHSIELITFKDEKSKKIYVSHGVCTYCLKNIILPNEPILKFIENINDNNATLTIDGYTASIKEHMVLSQLKSYSKSDIKLFMDTKKLNTNYFEVKNKLYETKYLDSFYKLLWCKFLDSQQSLDLLTSDNEIFNLYKNNKRKLILSDIKTQELLKLMKQPHSVRYNVQDMFNSKSNIIAQQTNCKGVMGKGLALDIKNKYPKVFEQYKILCSQYANSSKLLGYCQLVTTNGHILDLNKKFELAPGEQIIANLFGQDCFGNNLQTNYDALKKSLSFLRDFAKKNYLKIAIPYKIGCNLGGGNWDIVNKIITEVFTYYPITVYKLP